MPSVPVNKGLRKALLFSVNAYPEPLDSLDSEGGDSTSYSHCIFPLINQLIAGIMHPCACAFPRVRASCCSCNALRPLSINLAVVIFSDRDSRPLLIFRTRLSCPGNEFRRPVLSSECFIMFILILSPLKQTPVIRLSLHLTLRSDGSFLFRVRAGFGLAFPTLGKSPDDQFLNLVPRVLAGKRTWKRG